MSKNTRKITVLNPLSDTDHEGNQTMISSVGVSTDFMTITTGITSPIEIPTASLRGDHLIGGQPLTTLAGKKARISIEIEVFDDTP